MKTTNLTQMNISNVGKEESLHPTSRIKVALTP